MTIPSKSFTQQDLFGRSGVGAPRFPCDDCLGKRPLLGAVTRLNLPHVRSEWDLLEAKGATHPIILGGGRGREGFRRSFFCYSPTSIMVNAKVEMTWADEESLLVTQRFRAKPAS